MLVGLGSWAESVWAGPGVIVEARVEVFVMPSKGASVATELDRGASVCVLDATNHASMLAKRPGWVAIRIAGGVGYVPVEAVDLAASAPEVRDCGETSEPADPSDAPALARPPLTTGGFVPLNPMRFLLGMGTGVAWLNKRAAAEHGFDDSSLTFNATLGLVIWDVVMISGAYSGAFPSDPASFHEQVVPVGGGDPRAADSSVLINSFSIAAGLRTPFWALSSTDNGWATSLFAEYGTAAVTGTRTIEHCVDCREDDLHTTGGAFWHVGVDLLVPSRRPTLSFGLTTSYQHYAAGAGVSHEVRIGFNFWWHARRGR